MSEKRNSSPETSTAGNTTWRPRRSTGTAT